MPPCIPVHPEIDLTPFRPEDKPALVHYLNDPVIYANTLTIPNPYTEQDAADWLEKVTQRRETFGIESNWVIRHKMHGLIGGIGRAVNSGPDWHSDEIGYWLAEPFRNQGIMTAVVQTFSDWLFEKHPTLVRIEANVFTFNPASVRVLEKAGFEKEGIARKKHYKAGTYIDTILTAKIRAGV